MPRPFLTSTGQLIQLAFGSESSGSLTITSGVVTLDSNAANGELVGYRFTAAATVNGVAFAPGSYVFERNASAAGGWTCRALVAGTPIAQPAAPAGPVPTLDTFTMADGSLAGRVPDSGNAAAWSGGSGMGNTPAGALAPPVVGNKVSMAGNVQYSGKLPVPHTNGGTTTFEFDYTTTAGAPDSNVMFAFGDTDNYIYGSIRQNGNIVVYHFPSFTSYADVAAQPNSGRVSFVYSASAITLKVNGTTIATGSRAMTLVAPHVAIGTNGSANVATVDNLSVTSA